MLDVTDKGTYLDLSSRLSWIDELGPMEGLLSSDLNPDLWRVTAATSLLDVPEPGTLALLATGLVALGIIRRRTTVLKPLSRGDLDEKAYCLTGGMLPTSDLSSCLSRSKPLSDQHSDARQSLRLLSPVCVHQILMSLALGRAAGGR